MCLHYETNSNKWELFIYMSINNEVLLVHIQSVLPPHFPHQLIITSHKLHQRLLLLPIPYAPSNGGIRFSVHIAYFHEADPRPPHAKSLCKAEWGRG